MTRTDLPTAPGPCTVMSFEKCPDWESRLLILSVDLKDRRLLEYSLETRVVNTIFPLFFCGAQIGRHDPFFFFFPSPFLSFFFFAQRVPRHAILSHARSLTAASTCVWCPEFYVHWTRFYGCGCDAAWTPDSREGGVGGLRSWHPPAITYNQPRKAQFSTGFPHLGLATESRLKGVPIFLRKRPICLWGAPAWSTAHILRPCRGCAQTPLTELRRHLGDPQPPHRSCHACPEPQDLPRLQRSHLQTAWLR